MLYSGWEADTGWPGPRKTMTLIRVESNLKWDIVQGKGGAWVGICEPLKLTVQGETWAELMEDIGLTLNAVLVDLLAANELPAFLRDRGWRLLTALPPRSEEVRFDVPFFPAMKPNGPQRAIHQ